ncbi:MAG: hypothetical protein K1X72_04510 [Pyrinomonadaceae bacterium]|nr:hypothetical protein [Pyrinomonadaceae bacterium]
MSVESEITGSGILNFLACVLVAGVSILIGGSMFFGLLMEPDKAETFLFLVSFGAMLGGIGCAINCLYIITKRRIKWLYYLAFVVGITGYGMAVYGEAMYLNS